MARSLADHIVKRAIATAIGEPPADGSDLPLGHQKLFTFCRPSLDPGVYGIEAIQEIHAPNGETLSVFNYDSTASSPQPVSLQTFTVIAPQFQLDPKDINSYYPPDGHVDEGRILPHIVFNDPHVPWQRPAFSANYARRLPYQVPWLALITFDPEELAVTAEEALGLGIPDFDLKQPPSSGAYPMSVGQFLTKVKSRANYEVIQRQQNGKSIWKNLKSSPDPTSVIFPPISVIEPLFPKDSVLGVLLSHVREANVTGLPDATHGKSGLYSIIISQRSGPMDLTAPKSQVVHLVSVEHMASTNFDDIRSYGRIGMVSLFSWRYLCVPPNPTSVISIMKRLGDQKQMLRPPQQLISSIRSQPGNQTDTDTDPQNGPRLLAERLSLGYSISRWRVATGEETISFIRGPLVPTLTPREPSNGADWPDSSNSGKDYQILDRDLGVMDNTYSSAFQIGKLMAVSDPVFASALFRFRSLVQNRAASSARMTVNGVVPASTVINDAFKAVAEIRRTTKGNCVPARIVLPSSSAVAPPLRDPSILPTFQRAIKSAVALQTSAGEAIYSDYNLGKSNNSDWEIIHKWISDKLFLAGIPAHYLITDPSHLSGLPVDYDEGQPIALTSEALRFFYIDDAWMDCFIDGALSVANHLDPGDDFVRREIKEVYNVYLRNTIDPAPVKPPIPRYGFIIRSLVIKAIPDLRVTVRCRKATGPGVYDIDDSRAPLIRLTKIDDFTLLALLDCFPEHIHDITLSQPPHQQRFTAPTSPTEGLAFPVKQLFTSGAPDGPWPIWPDSRFPNKAQWFTPATRMLNLLPMAQDLNSGMRFSEPTRAFAANIDPAIFSVILNDDNFQLTILPPLLSAPEPYPPPDRQLWANPPPATPISPAAAAQRQSHIASPDDLNSVTPSVHPLSMLQPILSHPPSLNPSATPITIASSAALPTAAISSEYIMSIHPDYRGPAPRPFTPVFPPQKIYSARDYLPTTPIHRPDLIFSIHKNPSAPARDALLVSLEVIIPTNTTAGSDEPLLQTPYVGAGARMIHNHRLITLMSAPAGGQDLRVKIAPRSAALGQMVGLSNLALEDASFKLAACAVAPTRTPRAVQVHGLGHVMRGVCKVLLVERWAFASGAEEEAVGEVDVLKREGGDVDGLGNEV
ncbi:hypothetical protein B0T10DRAFT_500717 [Thelonectria olida]|uniref:Uncharacterized protein n=1 Tax=Thelonectria olida TaxID=1576542 RepID=A0A9P8VQH7_9HYPO|nr:hypothetical protein B0T10DRAFT_500717 [Thelonectria olida]